MSEPRVLVAPDKFKGSISATAVADCVAGAIKDRHPRAVVEAIPLADGGEGTVDIALAHGFTARSHRVRGPLGTSIDAVYAARDAAVVIESAAAAGLQLLGRRPDAETALAASSLGVGQLLAHVVCEGATHVTIGLGGSATTDGGLGLALALGAFVVDHAGAPVSAPNASGLAHVAGADFGAVSDRLSGVEVVLASDVDNPLLGPDGAAAVFGPQKGATPEIVERLDRALARWVGVVEDSTGQDLRHRPGSGAAGGMALPLLAAAGADLKPGIELAIDLAGARTAIDAADVVIVGEGSLDTQSLHGKGPVEVARRAKDAGAHVVAVVGTNRLTATQLVEAGIDVAYALTDLEPDIEAAIAAGPRLLREVSAIVADDLDAHLAAAGDPN